MPYSIVRQRVGDYAKWRRAFEKNAEVREAAGSRGGHLFRNPDAPAEIVIFLAWDDPDAARSHLEGSSEVEQEREAGDVTDRTVLVLEELGRPSH